MRFFIAVLLLLSVIVQNANGFVLNSGKSIHLKRGPFGALKMAANGAWGLKTISREKLFGIVSDAVAKQMDDVKKEDVKLEAHLVNDFEADSVDVVAMLLALEGNFKDDLTKTNTKVPMEKLGKVHTVKDLFDLMYDVVAEVESKK